MVSQKHGISALGLKRTLGIGSEQTVWAMLHRYRTAMVLPGRECLAGQVEVDEMWLGAPQPGSTGRGAQGKTMVLIAVESADQVIGRCRMQVAASADSDTLREFLRGNVKPGTSVITDGWPPYRDACGLDYEHQPVTIRNSGLQAHQLLPAVHRVAGLLKRWLLGTHQGGVKAAHLQAYLDEFTFRLGRRRSGARGMLFYRLLQDAIQAPPRTYRSLISDTPSAERPSPKPSPAGKHVHPATLAVTALDRPWRHNP